MSLHRTRTALCVAAIAASGFIGACGGDDPKPGSDPVANTDTVTTTQIPTVTVTVPETKPVEPDPKPAEPDPTPVVDPGPAAPLPPKPSKVSAGPTTTSGPPSKFKTCHGMSSTATLFRDINRVTGATEIWSHCWVGGFTGTVMVLLEDADGEVLTWAMPGVSWGVNGQSEAMFSTPSDRSERWVAAVEDPAFLPLVEKIEIVHSPAPRNRLVDILNEAVEKGKQVAPVVVAILAL